MNVGQVLETHLGVAAKALGFRVGTPVFDGIKEKQIHEYLHDARKKEGFTWVQVDGKARLFDGRTGDAFDQEVVVRSEEHTSELQSQSNLVCRLLLEKK